MAHPTAAKVQTQAEHRAERPPRSAGRNLQLNSLALMISSVVTGALGLVFWGVAARLFPPDQVGVASALITTAIMLSTLSNLSLGSMFERFIPVAGHRAGPLLVKGFASVALLALAAAVGFIALGPRDTLFENRLEIAIYPLFVVVLALFALQDQTVSGLGVARWAALKNVFHALAKLLAVIVLAATGSALAIVASWGITAAIAVIVLLVSMGLRIRSDSRYRQEPALPSNKELGAYFGSSYGITALGAIAPLVVPLIVVTKVGTAANAYFTVTWSIVSALYIMIYIMVGPFVAEVAAHPDKIADLSRRFVRTISAVAVVGGVGLAFVAPIALGFIGDEYRAEGTPLLHLAAVFVPFTVVGAVYSGLARVYRRLALAVVTQCLAAAVIIVGSVVLSASIGVAGVGWAYLAAETLTAVILAGPLISWLRQLELRSSRERRSAKNNANHSPVRRMSDGDA
ncbi:lipopolysaccharide biosynthesis protein [Rhodococcus marinonascens]|uniref:lipopolysaccharide biosynthesis protein n=1 Tax=Rhodococcus marinonascens TaxID=38311 RepID=UPI0009336106|nr:AMP-dependent synthetase [Rhodococcus marinonascens]